MVIGEACITSSNYRFRSLFRRSAVDGELDDELCFHMEQAVQKKLDAGIPPEEAQRQAQIEFDERQG